MPPSPATTTRTVLLALLVLALVTAVPPPSAQAVEAQGIRVDPVEPSVLGEGSVLQPALPPGASARYELRLRNTRAEDVEVLVYGADVTGEAEVGDGTAPSGVGSWITVDPARVALPAGETTTVAVTVTRPADDTDGGTGAVVAQLSEDTRRRLQLTSIQRVALRLRVAPDGTGDGVPVELLEAAADRGLLPGVLRVTVLFRNDTSEPAIFDGSVLVQRALGPDEAVDATVDVVAPGDDLRTVVEVDLPWYGLLGSVRAEAASVGVTTRSAPVGVTAPPLWALVLLLLAGGLWLWRARGAAVPFELGRVPGFGGPDTDDDTEDRPDGDDEDDADGDDGDDEDEDDDEGALADPEADVEDDGPGAGGQ